MGCQADAMLPPSSAINHGFEMIIQFNQEMIFPHLKNETESEPKDIQNDPEFPY